MGFPRFSAAGIRGCGRQVRAHTPDGAVILLARRGAHAAQGPGGAGAGRRAEAGEIRGALLIGLAGRTHSVGQHDDEAGVLFAGYRARRADNHQGDGERPRGVERVQRGGGDVVGCVVSKIPAVLTDGRGGDGRELHSEGSRAGAGHLGGIELRALGHGEVYGQWQRADIGKRSRVWGRAVRSRVRDGRGTAPTGGKQQEKQDTRTHTSLRS